MCVRRAAAALDDEASAPRPRHATRRSCTRNSSRHLSQRGGVGRAARTWRDARAEEARRRTARARMCAHARVCERVCPLPRSLQARAHAAGWRRGETGSTARGMERAEQRDAARSGTGRKGARARRGAQRQERLREPRGPGEQPSVTCPHWPVPAPAPECSVPFLPAGSTRRRGSGTGGHCAQSVAHTAGAVAQAPSCAKPPPAAATTAADAHGPPVPHRGPPEQQTRSERRRRPWRPHSCFWPPSAPPLLQWGTPRSLHCSPERS